VETTLGTKKVPVGIERLRVCELFAEILHLQYLYFSSPLFERLLFEGARVPQSQSDEALWNDPETDQQGLNFELFCWCFLWDVEMIYLELIRVPSVSDELLHISDQLIQHNAMSYCLVQYPFPFNPSRSTYLLIGIVSIRTSFSNSRGTISCILLCMIWSLKCLIRIF
jgi:hypothetical protein